MQRFQIVCLIFVMLFFNCNKKETSTLQTDTITSKQYLTILGVAQDAGFPQIDCKNECCASFYNGNESRKFVTSLGLVDLNAKKKWLFDATPDIAQQIQNLKAHHLETANVIDGVFLTHAHIGHYTGLMYFGREAMGAREIPVYVMPRLQEFIETNGPWNQLVTLNNIALQPLENKGVVQLNSNLRVTPFIVPHRDEFSETVGYKIEGKNKSALFIPDIDKWNLWNMNIIDEVKQVDYAFLDATFFKGGELNRPMHEVPHPFIEETVALFEGESNATKSKIYFIHFNHTNPALKTNHTLKDSITALGFNFAREGNCFEL